MPTIAANDSAQISLAAGNRLRFLPTGSGVAVVGNGPVVSAGTTYNLGSEETVIGPFDGPRAVSISASRLLDYEVQVPPFGLYLSNGRQVVLQDPATQALQGINGRLDGLLPITPPRILKRCLDAVGVGAANSGTAATVTIDAASPFGKPALRVAMPAGNTWHEVQLTGLNIANFDGHIVWRIWIEDYTQVQQIQTFAGTSGYTRFYQGTYRLNNSNENRWSGEHVPRSGPTYAGVTNSFVTGVDTLSDCKLRIFPGAAGANVWVESIFVPSVGRPTHCLTYDDCSVTWIRNVLPVLDQNRLRASFCVNTGDINGSAALYLSSSQVQQLAFAGHEISSHNVTNTAYNDGTGGTQNAATYTGDFRTAQNALSNLVGTAFVADYHAWVQGRNNTAVHDTMRAMGMRIGRGVDSADGYNFPQLGLGNGVMAVKNQAAHALSQAQMESVIATANRYGLMVVWMLHEVTQNGGVGVETSIANHRYLCERLAQERDLGRAVVPTMGQLARDLYANGLVARSLL